MLNDNKIMNAFFVYINKNTYVNLSVPLICDSYSLYLYGNHSILRLTLYGKCSSNSLLVPKRARKKGNFTFIVKLLLHLLLPSSLSKLTDLTPIVEHVD